ncbi:MAG: adenylate kinase [Pseudobdellovibrio sp.]
MTDFNLINFSKLKKINIVGTTGTGKSTLSKRLAILLKSKHIEIDQIFWGPNWKKPTNRDFYDNLKLSLEATHAWVLDGNYTKTTALKWAHAETVVWINLTFQQTLWQLCLRTLGRLISQKELWPNTGNKESIYGHLFTKDSIFYWFIKTFKGNQLKFKFEMDSSKWSHIQFIELTSNKEINLFVKAIQVHLNEK